MGGIYRGVGNTVGLADGTDEGTIDGCDVGTMVGLADGADEGIQVG